MTRFIIEYKDQDAKSRACYGELDESAAPEVRDLEARAIVGKWCPKFISIRRYYRVPQKRGKP